jgi:hypothetical protein
MRSWLLTPFSRLNIEVRSNKSVMNLHVCYCISWISAFSPSSVILCASSGYIACPYASPLFQRQSVEAWKDVEGRGFGVVLVEVCGCYILEVYVAGRRSGLLETAFSGCAYCSCVSKLAIIRSRTSCSRYRPTFLQPRILDIQEEESRTGCSAMFSSCRIHG